MAIGLERMSLPEVSISFIVTGRKIFAMDSTLGAETYIGKKFRRGQKRRAQNLSILLDAASPN
jgi:hypothetical protein